MLEPLQRKARLTQGQPDDRDDAYSNDDSELSTLPIVAPPMFNVQAGGTVGATPGMMNRA
jgi:hypothetical protein